MIKKVKCWNMLITLKEIYIRMISLKYSLLSSNKKPAGIDNFKINFVLLFTSLV